MIVGVIIKTKYFNIYTETMQVQFLVFNYVYTYIYI